MATYTWSNNPSLNGKANAALGSEMVTVATNIKTQFSSSVSIPSAPVANSTKFLGTWLASMQSAISTLSDQQYNTCSGYCYTNQADYYSEDYGTVYSAPKCGDNCTSRVETNCGSLKRNMK